MKKIIITTLIIVSSFTIQANNKIANRLNLTENQKETFKLEQEIFNEKIKIARKEMFDKLDLTKEQKEILNKMKDKRKNKKRELKIPKNK
jgi:Spy/CpxP family protein refolding chaperone